MTDDLTVVEVLAIHEDQIERYGGAFGVRDHDLLVAAVFRPQTGCDTDLMDEAAALWESLSQNHRFVDGNKRTAFAATYAFLVINGIRMTANSADAETFIPGLYSVGAFAFAALGPWLRANTMLENP